MDDKRRAVYTRLVQASLLIDEAASQSNRAATLAANAKDPIARIAEGVAELRDLAGSLEEISRTAGLLDASTSERLGTASRAAGRLACALLSETTRARAGLDTMHTSVQRSSECTQKASTLIKVA